MQQGKLQHSACSQSSWQCEETLPRRCVCVLSFAFVYLYTLYIPKLQAPWGLGHFAHLTCIPIYSVLNLFKLLVLNLWRGQRHSCGNAYEVGDSELLLAFLRPALPEVAHHFADTITIVKQRGTSTITTSFETAFLSNTEISAGCQLRQDRAKPSQHHLMMFFRTFHQNAGQTEKDLLLSSSQRVTLGSTTKDFVSWSQ